MAALASGALLAWARKRPWLAGLLLGLATAAKLYPVLFLLPLVALCIRTRQLRVWGRVAWGIWWTWDARLTSALVCWLLYAGYLMLRRAIEEPTQRATFAAVFSIFAFIDVPIVIFSIKWWRP